ncbi:thymidylate synthase [Patescibacteria group bacterium]|nr:thymidylate synthase [Patescibacteria group bacterium]
MLTVKDIRKKFIEKYSSKDIFIDEYGNKTIEIIGTSFIADEDYIIRKPNYDYINREIKWYKSNSLNVNDISEKVPTIWKAISDSNGFINSNYGWCVWSKENFNQYENTLNTLKKHPSSRRGAMIYNRPSMHYDFNKGGMNDFICTYGNTFFIRKNKLISHYIMRSTDCVFGYNNDRAWAEYIQKHLYNDLKKVYPNLELGNIIWTSSTLHVYERHFKFIKKLIEENNGKT